MTHKFTVEDIQMMAKQERDMDTGKQPYVLDKCRNRWSVMPGVMEELGLVSGQTVSDCIITAILGSSLASIQALIALDKAAKAKGG